MVIKQYVSMIRVVPQGDTGKAACGFWVGSIDENGDGGGGDFSTPMTQSDTLSTLRQKITTFIKNDLQRPDDPIVFLDDKGLL